jgi:hypothetical protein
MQALAHIQDNNMSIESALQRLGYTQEWLEFGVISKELVLQQYQAIQTAEDTNAEHYRWGGFLTYLRSKEALTDEEVDHIFQLSDHGPDKMNLRINRILAVINSGLLTHEQYCRLSRYPEISEPPIVKIYTRVKLFRAIEEFGLTEDLFEQVKNSTDAGVHWGILERSDLTYEQLVWLSERGGNKKIRNIAKQAAQRKQRAAR